MRTLVLICLLAAPAFAQPKVTLPDEAAGLDGIVRALIAALSVIPLGRLAPPPVLTGDIEPDFQKVDRALKTQVRPVLLSLQRSPFRDFRAEEFLGRTLIGCRGPGGCVSVFKGSPLTLGQIADAAVYVGP